MSERIIEGVRLSSPDKVLYAEQGVTKEKLAEYYVAVADLILPHVARRPVTLVRCPAGSESKCFYQRHAGSGLPPEVKEVAIPGFEEPYLYIEDLPGLIAIVQMGTLELHPWGVKVDRPDRPDRVIFDLDPDESLDFQRVIEAARAVRERLEAMGLQSFVKTTGGKGLHVVVPIEPEADWPTVKAFARDLASRMAEDEPSRYLARISKAEREGRIFIDYLRNDPTSTAVGPYSPRARPSAPVALPLAWEALDTELDPRAFTVTTVPALVADRRDPWAEMNQLRQALP